MPQFILLLEGTQTTWDAIPTERRAEIGRAYGEYTAWLRDRGAFVGGGAGDGPARRLVRAADGTVSHAHVADDQAAPTGYFIVEAADLDAAVALARECPALTHGEAVIVRRIG